LSPPCPCFRSLSLFVAVHAPQVLEKPRPDADVASPPFGRRQWCSRSPCCGPPAAGTRWNKLALTCKNVCSITVAAGAGTGIPITVSEEVTGCFWVDGPGRLQGQPCPRAGQAAASNRCCIAFNVSCAAAKTGRTVRRIKLCSTRYSTQPAIHSTWYTVYNIKYTKQYRTDH
jgi:hypothetical protein